MIRRTLVSRPPAGRSAGQEASSNPPRLRRAVRQTRIANALMSRRNMWWQCTVVYASSRPALPSKLRVAMSRWCSTAACVPSSSSPHAYSPTRYATMASRLCTFVLKLRRRTCSTLPRSMRCGSASPHVAGTGSSCESFVYARMVNVPGVSGVQQRQRRGCGGGREGGQLAQLKDYS